MFKLDDLAKAACEAEYPFPDDEWDEITDEETKRAWRRTALAVASKVLEMVEDTAERHECGNVAPECCNCLGRTLDDIRRMVEGMKGSGT